jgi:beta-glucosidase
MSDWQAVAGGEAQRDEFRAADEDLFLEAARGDDFIGVQTYTRRRVGPDGVLDPEPGVPLTTMGYERRPQALGATIRRAAEVAGVPVLVTENGIATDDDAERIGFVHAALESVLDCLADGIDVRGYFHWSALDNFEWAYGYAPRFGLVAVDRETQERTPKPSAAWLGGVARANALPATGPAG